MNKVLTHAEIILKLIKANKYNEVQEFLNRQICNLHEIELQAKKVKIDEINKTIFHINILINDINMQYKKIKNQSFLITLSSVEDYLTNLKKFQRLLVVRKRNLSRKTMKI